MPTPNLLQEDTVFLQVLKICEHSFLNEQLIYNLIIRKQAWSTLSWQKLIKFILLNLNLSICLESIMDFHWGFSFDFERSKDSVR